MDMIVPPAIAPAVERKCSNFNTNNMQGAESDEGDEGFEKSAPAESSTESPVAPPRRTTFAPKNTVSPPGDDVAAGANARHKPPRARVIR